MDSCQIIISIATGACSIISAGASIGFGVTASSSDKKTSYVAASCFFAFFSVFSAFGTFRLCRSRVSVAPQNANAGVLPPALNANVGVVPPQPPTPLPTTARSPRSEVTVTMED